MKRLHSDSDYDSAECSSPEATQMSSRKKRRGIIEKRRRDRINSCLAELKRLVPAAFEKQGSAKLEKAEILQMTVDHLKHLHQTQDPRGSSELYSPYGNTKAFLDYRLMGFKECVEEASRYMISMEGMESNDPLRQRLLSHLECYLSQRVHAINAGIAASTQKPLVNALFQAPSVSGMVTPKVVPTGKDYMLAPKVVPFVTPTTSAIPPFIPVPAMNFSTVAMTTIPVAMPTKSTMMTATKPDSLQSKSLLQTKSSNSQSPKFTFRPWVDDKTP